MSLDSRQEACDEFVDLRILSRRNPRTQTPGDKPRVRESRDSELEPERVSNPDLNASRQSHCSARQGLVEGTSATLGNQMILQVRSTLDISIGNGKVLPTKFLKMGRLSVDK